LLASIARSRANTARRRIALNGGFEQLFKKLRDQAHDVCTRCNAKKRLNLILAAIRHAADSFARSGEC
jgi:hypothetical protein